MPLSMIVFARCVPAASIHHPEQQCQLPPACNLWMTCTGGRVVALHWVNGTRPLGTLGGSQRVHWGP
jgi:hypothetical protein